MPFAPCLYWFDLGMYQSLMLFTMGIYYKVWELEGRTQHMGKTTQVQAKHIVHGDIFSMETCRIWIIKQEYLPTKPQEISLLSE